MIELAMVRRMVVRALAVAPAVVALAWGLGGARTALSAAAGLAMALGNLWLAGRIIGGVADASPGLLVGAALVAFATGLGLLTAAALGLHELGLVSFRVTGLTLVGAHLGLVLWEAARALPSPARPPTPTRGW